MKLFFDIETLPAGPDKEPVIKEMYAKYRSGRFSANSKTYEEFLRSTSFDGAFGRILCIGYAIDNEPAKVFKGKDEKEVLENFWATASKAKQFIGHNVFEFDIPFIYQRSIVHQVKPKKHIPLRRYTNDVVYDTYFEWTRWSRSHNKGSLDRLAKAFGFKTSKQGIDGSQVYDYYRVGRIKEIKDYCKRDVELTRKIYKRLTFGD